MLRTALALSLLTLPPWRTRAEGFLEKELGVGPKQIAAPSARMLT